MLATDLWNRKRIQVKKAMVNGIEKTLTSLLVMEFHVSSTGVSLAFIQFKEPALIEMANHGLVGRSVQKETDH